MVPKHARGERGGGGIPGRTCTSLQLRTWRRQGGPLLAPKWTPAAPAILVLQIISLCLPCLRARGRPPALARCSRPGRRPAGPQPMRATCRRHSDDSGPGPAWSLVSPAGPPWPRSERGGRPRLQVFCRDAAAVAGHERGMGVRRDVLRRARFLVLAQAIWGRLADAPLHPRAHHPPPPTAHDAGERKATRTLFSVEGCVLLPVEVLSLWSRSGRTRPWARAHVTCASSTRSFPLGASSRQVRHGGVLCAAGGACGGAP